ncbi:LysR family transcriptional regulator [Prauserella muralis]|uniref:LysR family transcriptional regulator n=1 Tax=Prauserella muralis TaxID=588067 RepID=A0A2V4B1B8_9PSEU|nr:LysR family transcriptional regulator [Prauserella muralis]PXY27782.1 LysR family transcriptional regulator [Prauserella muralis]TWE22464.1 DNA-binding transcriptional LysR family regulator [Prauserella muralis]
MDVRSLRYALTLAEELHFGRAARAHFIAAQPFGRRIQELERELGTRLFERTSRRVSLTEAGERFLPRARRVLAQLDALLETAEGERAEPVLRVGVLGFGLADRWPAARSILSRCRPDLVLTYVELDWPNQYDAVRTGEVDIAIVHDVGGADDLVVESVMDTRRYAVVPAESELADADHLTESDAVDRPWVVPVGQPGLANWAGGHAFRNQVQVRSPTHIPVAVATSGHLGVHAEPAARFLPHPGVRYLPLDGPHATVAIASRRRERRGTVAAFRAAVHASATVQRLAHDTTP